MKSRSILRVSTISGGASAPRDRGRRTVLPVGFTQVQAADMRLRVAGAVLLAAAAYYVYLPLPTGVCEPWKLMLLDALFRSFMKAVRGGGCTGGREEEEGEEENRGGGGQVHVEIQELSGGKET